MLILGPMQVCRIRPSREAWDLLSYPAPVTLELWGCTQSWTAAGAVAPPGWLGPCEVAIFTRERRMFLWVTGAVGRHPWKGHALSGLTHMEEFTVREGKGRAACMVCAGQTCARALTGQGARGSHRTSDWS